VQDLLLGLLQADPARRPSVHAVLRAGILQDAFRLVQQLPHWRLLEAAAAAPQSQPQQQLASLPAAASQQALGLDVSAEAAEEAVAASVPALQAPVDHDAVRHFLLLLRKAKQQELAQAEAQMAALDADIVDVRQRRRRHGESGPSNCTSQQPGDTERDEESVEQQQQQQPAAKRARMDAAVSDSGSQAALAPAPLTSAPASPPEDDEALAAAVDQLPEEQQLRVAAMMPQLESLFFHRRQQDAAAAAPAAEVGACEGGAHLDSFAQDLNQLAAHSKLTLKATLRSSDLASPVEMVRCHCRHLLLWLQGLCLPCVGLEGRTPCCLLSLLSAAGGRCWLPLGRCYAMPEPVLISAPPISLLPCPHLDVPSSCPAGPPTRRPAAPPLTETTNSLPPWV
jgi:hypothetical protein